MKSAPESKLFSTKQTLNVRGRLMDLSIPRVMGVLNVTPDSFYDGGRYTTEEAILVQAGKMLDEGATFIDIGAYSSRPGAQDISIAEELKRATTAVGIVAKRFPAAIISIDTFRSEVAHAAIQEGAGIVNDISGGALDPNMIETVSRLRVPYIAMHMRGTPQTMTQHTTYQNLVKDIVDYFHQKILLCHQHGIVDVIVDPGFGFSKTVAQNFELLRALDYFNVLGMPLLVGLSRKSMIWKTLSIHRDEALNGTTTLNTLSLVKGANILRVHDVKEAVEAVTLFISMKNTAGE